MERMRQERARYTSTSTLASSTNNSEPATCYAEIVKYIAHLWRRTKRRLIKKLRLYKYDIIFLSFYSDSVFCLPNIPFFSIILDFWSVLYTAFISHTYDKKLTFIEFYIRNFECCTLFSLYYINTSHDTYIAHYTLYLL